MKNKINTTVSRCVYESEIQMGITIGVNINILLFSSTKYLFLLTLK
jgi:hypothetical protein